MDHKQVTFKKKLKTLWEKYLRLPKCLLFGASFLGGKNVLSFTEQLNIIFIHYNTVFFFDAECVPNT